jgi:hypothetical protein
MASGVGQAGNGTDSITDYPRLSFSANRRGPKYPLLLATSAPGLGIRRPEEGARSKNSVGGRRSMMLNMVQRSEFGYSARTGS